MEGAARVFAREFCASTLSVQDEHAGGPAWVVTPSGGWCRLMYIAGALTEREENGDMLYCRIADPTGAFDLAIGGRNTAVAEAFKNLSLPSFVTVTGRAQMYRKTGKVALSVRPDQVNAVDRAVRDRWVLATAESTLLRLEQVHLAMSGRCSDERVSTAFRHYALTADRLQELAAMVEDAVRSIRSPEDGATMQTDVRSLVLEIIRANSGPYGIAVEKIIEQAAESGVAQEAVLATVEALILEDECYQPRKGFVKTL